jgi:hypothetical protein
MIILTIKLFGLKGAFILGNELIFLPAERSNMFLFLND